MRSTGFSQLKHQKRRSKVKKINYFLVSFSPNHQGFEEVKKSKPENIMHGLLQSILIYNFEPES
jgi:hypothetical protein